MVLEESFNKWELGGGDCDVTGGVCGGGKCNTKEVSNVAVERCLD